MNAISIYIPCPDKRTAKSVSRHLLRKRLIACANIFPIHSMYWWKGKLMENAEHVIFAKSLEKRYADIVQEARKVHPYEVPLIAKFKIKANEDYLKWLRKETRK